MADNNLASLHQTGADKVSADIGGGTLSIFSDSESFATAMKMADVLSLSTVIPKEYQGNPGNCLIAIEMSTRINTSPMMVMQNLYIVNGRPAWSSQWIIAMINSSHRYKTELQFEFGNDPEDGGLSCRAWAEDFAGHRVNGPKVTMKMANAEGWVSKNGSKWKTMPDVMIQYRAASFFGRMNCPDMIMGIYSKDEVVEMDDLPSDDYALVMDPETGDVQTKRVEPDRPATKEERQKMFRYANELFGDSANEVLKAMLSEFGIESTEGMPISIYEKIMDRINEMADEIKEKGSSQSAE